MHRAVATVAPPMDRLHPDLRPAVQRAFAFGDKYNREFAVFLDQFLEQTYKDHAGENLKRFRDSVDIMLGRKKRYDSQSVTYHFPNLAPIEFFERADFPWLDPIEAGTDAIRDEFLQVLATEEGFTPYISYPDDVPQNQFAELNNSPRWSAFHLYKMGKLVEENAARCPHHDEVAGRRAPAGSAGTHARGDVFAAEAQDPDSAAHGCDERAPGHAPAADRSRGLRIPRRQRHATMDSRQGVGVRRHDRARGMERQRQAARRPDLRHLAPAPDAARAGDDFRPFGRDECLQRRAGSRGIRADAKKTANPAVRRRD